MRRPKIESILSREFTFLLNNWVLCSLLFFILVATTFPLISEALTGEKVTVGPPFYKAWVQPLGVLLLVLMGVGTNFGWKKTSVDGLRKAFRAPLAAMGSAVALHFAIGRSLGFPAVVWSDPIYSGPVGAALRVFNAFSPVIGISLCVFNAAVIVQEFALLLRARARAGSGERTPSVLWWLGGLPGLVHTLVSLPPQSRRRYGGYICHFGIVLMFMGFTGQSWNVDREASIFPGQTFAAEDYTLSYVGARMEVDNSKRMVFADVDVYKHGKLEERLSPGKFIYKKQPESPTTEVAIGHGLRDDVYLIVGSIDPFEQEPRGIPASHQPARLVDLDRLHNPHRGQHRVHVAAGRIRRVSRLGRGARGRGHGGEHRLRDHARSDPYGSSADDVGAHGHGPHRERYRAFHLRIPALHVRDVRA